MRNIDFNSDEPRHVSRLFWALIVLTSTFIVTYLIITGFEGVSSNPFVVSYNPSGNMTELGLDFPTITICNKQVNIVKNDKILLKKYFLPAL